MTDSTEMDKALDTTISYYQRAQAEVKELEQQLNLKKQKAMRTAEALKAHLLATNENSVETANYILSFTPHWFLAGTVADQIKITKIEEQV